MKIRKNTRALLVQFFDLVTFRAGGFLLWLTCIFFPFGQHRLWLRVGGWWLYPVFASLSFLALKLTRFHLETHPWAKLLCLPLAVVAFLDMFFIIFFAELPPGAAKEEGAKK